MRLLDNQETHSLNFKEEIPEIKLNMKQSDVVENE